MPLLRLLAAHVVALALCLPAASAPVFAQAATPSQLTLKKARERGAAPETEESGGMTQKRRLSLCIESWDAQTHMTKREWRVACERSVKTYRDTIN
jgi:hypothetical protein